MADELTATAPACPFSGPTQAAPGEVPAGPPARRRPKRGYLLPGTIALVVCAALAVGIDVAGLQSRTPDRLAGADVDTFLAQAVQRVDGRGALPSVRCPPSEPVGAGVSFTCSLSGDGAADAVRVTEISRSGTLRFRVVRPG